jgi:hypothetical protein
MLLNRMDALKTKKEAPRCKWKSAVTIVGHKNNSSQTVSFINTPLSHGCQELFQTMSFKNDGLVKSQGFAFFVIPAKAGIQ